MSIHQTIFGGFLDLSKLVHVGEVCVMSGIECCTLCYFQLMEHPVPLYTRGDNAEDRAKEYYEDLIKSWKAFKEEQ